MTRKAIGYHYTFMSASLAQNGKLWPNLLQVESPEKAMEQARQDVKDGNDVYECDFGCLTVFDDGSVSHESFTVDEIEPEGEASV